MQLSEGIRLALVQIWSQKLKSLFSLLGVIIGVMFLLVVVSVVEGMDRYIREDFSSRVYGINTVNVRRTPSLQIGYPDPDVLRAWGRRPRLTYDDADLIRQRLGIPALVGVRSTASGQVEGDNGRAVENVLVTGLSSEILEIQNLQVERGRLFSPQEDRQGQPVVILGKSTADVLFEGVDPLGRRVRIRGFPFRVIGVLEEQGSILGRSRDNVALAPARSPIQDFTNPRGIVDQIVVQTTDPSLVEPLRYELEAIMRLGHRLRPSDPLDFELETAEASLSFWDTISRILFIALPGLVGISLVVGGIVIMNIMLVSVLERTREIGVRKAIGARRRDIMTQVLIESSTLSAVGALIGVGVGVALTYVVRAVSPLPAAVAPHWVAMGMGLGVVVGVLAGVIPASRASRLDPVDALRYE